MLHTSLDESPTELRAEIRARSCKWKDLLGDPTMGGQGNDQGVSSTSFEVARYIL